ncbi:MAG: NFACT family protein [Planctomycetes bacterium]|nr:NFACT family protein [Planctomycetota bacterium]
MSMTLNELEAVLAEAAPLLKERTLLAFRDAGPDCFMLVLESETASSKMLRLLLSVRPGLDRMHLTPRRSPKKNRVKQTAFAARVEEALQGARLGTLGMIGLDRIVRIAFQNPEGGMRFLVIELIGRHANLLVLDENDTILELIRSFKGKYRNLFIGEKYHPPIPPAKIPRPPPPLRFDPEGETPWREAPINGAADLYFLEQERVWERDLWKERLQRHLSKRLQKENGRLHKLEADREAAGRADLYRKYGDLLQANFVRLKKGMSTFEAEDLYTPENEPLLIPLDPAKDPAANIDRYYRRAKKLKQSITHLSRMISEAEVEIDRLEEVRKSLTASEDLEGLQELAVILGLLPAAAPSRSKSARETLERTFRKFRSRDGLTVLVGKDGASNDRLTFQTGRGNDIWLHCREAAGSHVVIRQEGKKPVPLNSLVDAGLLAKHFSKRRDADRAEVIYTQRKYVKKIRGAPPGRVQVERFKTLMVAKAPKHLKMILDSAE